MNIATLRPTSGCFRTHLRYWVRLKAEALGIREFSLGTYEVINTLISIVAVCISCVALVRSRKVARQQKELEEQNLRISALTALLSEYQSRASIFEKALVDGTIERENLSRVGMEQALSEYQEKQYQALSDIESELSQLRRSKT